MSYIANMRIKILTAVALLFVGFGMFLGSLSLRAQELPFRGVASEELSRLEKGERVFRELDSYKEARLETQGRYSRELLELLEEVDPNFLAEILMVIPVDPERENLEYLQDALMRVTNYDTIPYYSVDNEKWYKLFYDSELLSSKNPEEGKTVITALHRMKPFKTHETRYEYVRDGDVLFFNGTNTSSIHYNRFRAVKEGNMQTLLWIRDEGDRLLVYGAGGAKAFTFFGLFGSRMDDAFVGRMDAFFAWFYDNYITEIMHN